MISAVTDSCSVRYAQLDRKIYKFQSLVFKEVSQVEEKVECQERQPQASQSSQSPLAAQSSQGEQKENAEKQAETLKGILSTKTDSEWRRAYGEYLHQMKESKASDVRPVSPSAHAQPTSKRAKTEKKVQFQDEGEFLDVLPNCATCSLPLARSCEDFNTLMARPKEELVAMLVNLKQLALRNSIQRKKGYCPTEEELQQLQEGSEDVKMTNVEEDNRSSKQPSKARPWKKVRRTSSSS